MSSEMIIQDLVKAVQALYRACPNIPFKDSRQMETAVRAADKGQLYLDGDFENLWIMEHEEKEMLRAQQRLVRPAAAPLESVEVHDTPPSLARIPNTTSQAVAPLSPSAASCASAFKPIRLQTADRSISPIAYQGEFLKTTPNLGPLLPSPVVTRSGPFNLDF